MGRIFIVDVPFEEPEDLDDYVERKLIRREAQWFNSNIQSKPIPIPKS
jgi:hypothetical protein